MADAYQGISRLHLNMGMQCNARCVMCYQSEFGPSNNMLDQVYEEHLAQLYPHLDGVKIQGGEPFIMNNCRRFAKFIRGWKQLKLTTVTNGVFMDDFWLETFQSQGRHINFSLNAATVATYDTIVKRGNLALALGNIRRLLQSRRGSEPQVSISAVILSYNLFEISRFIELGAELGVDDVIFMVDPVLSFCNLPAEAQVRKELERAREALETCKLGGDGLHVFARRFGMSEFARPPAARSRRCPLPFNSLVVDETGDVRVCCQTWVRLGNTFRAPLNEIVEGPVLTKFRRMADQGDYSWCSPTCPDNPAPRKKALVTKYFYLARKDPRAFAAKIREKLRRRKLM